MARSLILIGVVPFLVGGVCKPTLFQGDPRVQDIHVPPGFHVDIFADDVPNARELAYSPAGIVYAGSMDEGDVYALPDMDHDGVADTVITIIEGLRMPVGVAWHNGDLYVSAVDRILVLPGIDAHLKNPPAPRIVTDHFPNETHHGWKFIAFGPDGRLYVPVGAPCNICLSEDSVFATVLSMLPDGTDMRIEARGVRNSVGFDWDPQDGSLWFTENGRDWMGDDMPSCELDHLTQRGQHFGYPFCHQGDTLDPEFGKGHACSEFVPPVAKLGPHVAPLGMRFYQGNMFPERYKGAMFIAEHGSWNRTEPTGYRVVAAFRTADGTATQEVFADGWLKANHAWGRPVDVLPMPDGALLISDDAADMIYRITYTGD